MRIVHVAEYASGGVATYLRNIVASQIEDSSVDEIVLINSKKNSEKLDFNSNKFRHITFDYSRSISGIIRLLKVRKIIDSLDPDVVHFHSSFAGIIRLTYLVKLSHYKVVYCAHGWSFLQKNKSRLQKKVYEVIERLAALKTDTIINISRSEQQAAVAHDLPEDKMELVYNTIPNKRELFPIPSPFSNLPTKKLLFVGRFDEQKGLKFLLKNVDFENYGVELVVIGSNVLESSKIASNVTNVTFLGWIDNKYIDSYISICDAVIVPSKWEGFGLVAVEAMKNEKMVIASDAGGLSEIIVNNYSGLIFKAGSPQKLNEAIAKFAGMGNPKIKLMGHHGKDIFSSKYNFSELHSRLMQIYKLNPVGKRDYTIISSEKYEQ
ncbi:glycosyltransferase [Lactiplantibacillus songbeiensis]|uniref:Glycosyltransferase n=1 Tax=Lactiplantibacillus songbeiensis TaxID=2559920 RepID=A0ABW4C566_9LACO|nr:glycosyltransferase [Lactiplantibacillus songbeiensis]